MVEEALLKDLRRRMEGSFEALRKEALEMTAVAV